MSSKVQVEVVINAGANCWNRGEDGTPKKTMYGETQRNEVSPYCFKRMLRNSASAFLPGIEQSFRSRDWVNKLAEQIKSEFKEDAILVAICLFAAGQEGLDGFLEVTMDSEDKIDSLFTSVAFLSESQLKDMKAACLQNKDILLSMVAMAKEVIAEEKAKSTRPAKIKIAKKIGQVFETKSKESGKSKKKNDFGKQMDSIGEIRQDIFERDDSIMQAAFGTFNAKLKHRRQGFLSAEPLLTVHEGMGIPALFTVHDDLRQFFDGSSDAENNEETGDQKQQGASTMGTTHHCSSVLYGSIGIPLEEVYTLCKSKFGDKAKEMTKSILLAFAKGLLTMTPTAKLSTFRGSKQPPVFLRIEISDDPISNMPAFEIPVRQDGNGIVTEAIKRLNNHVTLMDKVRRGLFNKTWEGSCDATQGQAFMDLIDSFEKELDKYLGKMS